MRKSGIIEKLNVTENSFIFSSNLYFDFVCSFLIYIIIFFLVSNTNRRINFEQAYLKKRSNIMCVKKKNNTRK